MYKKNTAVTGFCFTLSASGNAPGTGITTGTTTCYITLDGTFLNSTTATYDASANAWKLNLTAAQMNGDIVSITVKNAAAQSQTFTIETETYKMLDLLTVLPPLVWTNATRTLSSFGTLISDIWANATRSLTDKAGFTISGTKTTLDSLNDITSDSIWSVTTRQLTGTQVFNNTGTWTGNITGSVASVTGNVSGNVSGSVGSVTSSVTVGDKTGFSLTSPQTFNLTGSITGDLSGSVGSVSGNVGGNVAGSVNSVTSAVTVGAINNNVITASSIATDAITADKIATDAIGSDELADSALTEIENIVWDASKASHTTVDTFGEYLDEKISSRLASTDYTDVSDDVNLIKYTDHFVYVDLINGSSGQVKGTNGVPENPSGNLTDAIAIAGLINSKKLKLIGVGSISLQPSVDYSGWEFEGENRLFTVTLLSDGEPSPSGPNVDFCTFRNVNLTGYQGGVDFCAAYECKLEDLENLRIQAERCTLSGDIHLSGNSPTSGGHRFLDCRATLFSSFGPVNMYFDSTPGTTVWIRGFLGRIQINTMISGQSLAFDSFAGAFMIAASCTGGTIRVRGINTIQDSSGLTDLDASGNINDATLVDNIWAAATRDLTDYGTLVDDIADAVWSDPVSEIITADSIGKKLVDWELGTDNKVLLSSDAQTSVVIPNVTTVGSITGNLGGNVVGNVNGNVVGSTASVTGNVGGNVVGSVGGVTGNVTGNLGGNVGGNVVGNVNGTVEGGVSLSTGAITNTSFAANAIDSTVIANNTITAGKIATDAITDQKISADAVTKIQTGLATQLLLEDVDAEVDALRDDMTDGLGALGKILYAQEAIWIDLDSINTGTVLYTDGIPSNPVNSIANAKILADQLNYKKFMFIGQGLITLDVDYTFYYFGSIGKHMFDLNGKDISGSTFNSVAITGNQGLYSIHLPRMIDCAFASCTNLQAVIERSYFLANVTIGPGKTDITDCQKSTISQGDIVFGFEDGMSASKIVFTRFSGGIQIDNMTSNHHMSVRGLGMGLTFNASCSGGEVNVEGMTNIVDNSGGNVTINNVNAVDSSIFALANWDTLTSVLTTNDSIGKKLSDWVLGSDSKVLLSNNAQTGVTIPTVTNITNGVDLNADQSGVTIGVVNDLGTEANADVVNDVDTALLAYDANNGVARESTVAGLITNSVFNVIATSQIVIPAAGDDAYKFLIYYRDTDGLPVDPDSNEIAMTLTNNAGGSELGLLYQDSALTTALVDSITWVDHKKLVKQETGIYYFYLKVASTETHHQFIYEFNLNLSAVEYNYAYTTSILEGSLTSVDLTDNTANKLVIAKSLKTYDASALVPVSGAIYKDIMDLTQDVDDEVDNIETLVEDIHTHTLSIKDQTDLLRFTGNDVKATLDSEKVTVVTNEDKTGYSLTPSYDSAQNAATQTSVTAIALQTTAIKGKTDQLSFTSGDVHATLDGETVELTSGQFINTEGTPGVLQGD